MNTIFIILISLFGLPIGIIIGLLLLQAIFNKIHYGVWALGVVDP